MGKIPQNANFWGVKRHFQAKRAKSKMVYIIETMHRLQILHNNRDHQMLFVGGLNKRTTNQRWRTTAILKKL